METYPIWIGGDQDPWAEDSHPPKTNTETNNTQNRKNSHVRLGDVPRYFHENNFQHQQSFPSHWEENVFNMHQKPSGNPYAFRPTPQQYVMDIPPANTEYSPSLNFDSSESDGGEESSAASSVANSYDTLPGLPPPVLVATVAETRNLMESFPEEEVVDFKHLIYNLLVETHNHPEQENLLLPISFIDKGSKLKNGFQFNEKKNPDKMLPEVYVRYLKKANLQNEDQNSPLIKDLYKFYLRSCIELLSKYFEKIDKYTYLYDEDSPLFLPGDSLQNARNRIREMKTRARKKKGKKMPKYSRAKI